VTFWSFIKFVILPMWLIVVVAEPVETENTIEVQSETD
jgi:hypothetical protein